jgi:hypothetical protein
MTDTPPIQAESPIETPKKPRRKAPVKSVANKTPTEKRKRTTNGGYKHDWNMVRNAFVEGLKDPNNPDERLFLNLKDLSERMNISNQLVRERSAEERWYDQRQVYQMKLSKSRQVKRINELAKESVDFDSKSLQAAKLGIAMVTTRMSEIARDVQEQQHKRSEAMKLADAGFAVDPRDFDSVIDARELDTLSRAAIQWQQLGQKAMGTDVQKIDINHDIQGQIDLDVEVTSVTAELSRDDPERLAAFFLAAKRAGLMDTVLNANEEPEDQLEIESGVIVDAEIIEPIA